jgi:hypothetical protein
VNGFTGHLYTLLLKKIKVKGWKKKMRDREQWRLVVEEAKAHPGL